MSTGKVILVTIGLFFLIALTIPIGLGFLLWIGSCIWVGMDSKSIEFHKYKSQISTTPVTLAFGTALLWIVIFPWYLIIKGKILNGTAELKEEFKQAG